MKAVIGVAFVVWALIAIIPGSADSNPPEFNLRQAQAEGVGLARIDPDDSQVENRKTVVTGKKKGTDSELVLETKQYEATLNELAQQAQRIVNELPNDPARLAKNFGDLGDVLRKSKKHLLAILQSRPELDQQANKILNSAAGVQQHFIDLEKRIDVQIKQVQLKTTSDNPVATAAGIQMLEGVKTACKSGQSVMIPLRDHVMAAQNQSQAVFTEIEMYPLIFDLAIEACDLYKSGIGDSTSYIEVVRGLIKAKENLRAIVLQFGEAAKKAEILIQHMPTQGLTGLPLTATTNAVNTVTNNVAIIATPQTGLVGLPVNER